MNAFSLLRTSGRARAGELSTPHGVIPTPVLCPVATQGSVKALTPQDVRDTGLGMVLSNTYHLYLRPGIDTIQKLGGLHRFMNWDEAILTDSGGYQVFSLSRLRTVTDEGVVFRSHIDGSRHTFTPELAIQYQERLGSDIAMVLDEVASHDDGREKVWAAMVRTHAWAERCLKAHAGGGQALPRDLRSPFGKGGLRGIGQALFAIVQGGVFPELRRESAGFLTSLDFDGYAIGGLSIGEAKQVTFDITEETAALLPEDRPRYLMGVGSPEDIVECVGRGIDIFDCALPTRVARNGALYTKTGRVDILNARFREMADPVEPGCDCYTCRNFSAAYLNHLFRSKELLAYRLATIHNLAFMASLVRGVRQSILEDRFESFRGDFLSTYRPTDEATRLAQKRKWAEGKRRDPSPMTGDGA